MKQFKVILIIFGLLLTGFGAGFFTHRAMVGKHLERVRALGRGPGFGQHLLQQIEASPEQREQLLPLLKDYGQRMGTLTRENRRQRRLLMDSMFVDIKPMLSEDQIDQLEKETARFREKNNRQRSGKQKKMSAEGKKATSKESNE